jgi:hypothetical protein
LDASTCAKAKFVDALVAYWAASTIFYFPRMLAIYLVVGIYLKRNTLVVLLLFAM